MLSRIGLFLGKKKGERERQGGLGGGGCLTIPLKKVTELQTSNP